MSTPRPDEPPNSKQKMNAPLTDIQEEKKRLRVRPSAFGVAVHEAFKGGHHVTPRPRPPTPPPMFSKFEMEAAKMTPREVFNSPVSRLNLRFSVETSRNC